MSSIEYLESKKLVFDSIKCNTGKLCGETCISQEHKCNISSTKSATLKNPKTTTENKAGYVTGGVAIGATLGAAAIAAGLGVFGAATLYQARKRYQENFAVSAVRAEVESKNIKAPTLGKEVETVILTVGGFGTKDAYSESEVLRKNIESLEIKGLYVEPQSYAEFNVPTRPVDEATKKQAQQEAKNLFIKTVFEKGYNPVAVSVAAKIIATKKVYPEKQYQLMGHSGGGLVVQEAHEILHKAGIKMRTTAIGSPDVGLIPGTGDLVTAVSKHDGILKMTTGRGVNGKNFDNVLDHGQNSYFADSSFREFIKQRLSSIRRDKADGKPCGKGYISAKLKCRSGLNLSIKSPSNDNQEIKTSLGLGLAIGLITPVAAGAALIGIPASAYLGFRNRYREGFKASAEKAEIQSFALEKQMTEEISKKLNIPPEKLTNTQKTAIVKADKWDAQGNVTRSSVYAVDPKRPSIGFTIGGFNDYGELGFGLANQMASDLPNHSLIPLTNKKVNITPEMTWLPMNDIMAQELDDDGKGGKVKRGYLSRRGFDDFMGNVVGKENWNDFRDNKLRTSEQYKSIEPVARELIRYKSDLQMLYDNATQKLNNADAIDAAAHAMMYKRLFPDKDIHFIGHSGGGIVAAEAMEILKQKNIKSKGFLIATPYFGLTELKKDELVTIGSREKLQSKDKDTSDEKTASQEFHEGIKRVLPVDKMMVLPVQNFQPLNVPSVHNWLENPAGDDYKKGYRGYGQLDQTYEEARGFFYGKSNAIRENATIRRKLSVTNQQQMQRLVFGQKKADSVFRIDKAKCKIGHNCGDICIPKTSTCKVENNNLKLSQNPSNQLAIGSGIAAGAAIMGIPTAAYLIQKARFKAGFSNSAELAKEQAKTYKVPNTTFTGFRSISDQQLPGSSIKSDVTSVNTGKPAHQITFFAGGIGAVDGLEGDHMGLQVAKMLSDHHVVGIETPEQEVSFAQGDTVASPRYLKKVVSALLKDNLTKGRSEVAVRIAARAYAYHQKHPGLPINLIGQSGGGMPVREAEEILKKIGVKDIRVVTAGSPYFGLTSPSGISLIDPKKDPVDKIYGATMPNKVPVNVVGHMGYFSNTPYKLYDENGVWKKGVSSNIFNESVPNESVKEVLIKHFDRNKNIESSRVSKDSSDDNLQQIKNQFSILLSRSYGKPIVKVGGIKITLDNNVIGLAQDSLGKILEFTFKDNKFTYKLSRNSAKLDSYYRQDRKILKKKCRKGISCGDTCIEANDTCKLSINQIATPNEIARLKQSIVQFKLEQNQAIASIPQNPENNDIPVKSKYIVNPQTGIPYTIRELRKQAQEKRIYGYGSMTIKELQGTLQLYDQKPESRDKITRGISKRTGFSTKAIASAGLSGRGTPLERSTKRSLKNTADVWRKLEALAKFASTSPVSWSAAAVGAFLIGRTIKGYEQAKQSYREGFNESARMAEEQASKLNLQHPLERDGEPSLLPNGKPRMTSRINQDNITFAIGSGKGYGAEEMKSLLQREKNADNAKDYWLTHSNYVIPFNLKEFGTPQPEGGGEPGIASTVVNGVGGIIQNFARKRNQDAVDLAASIYAHAIAISPQDGKTLVNRSKKINIVAHCNGGLVTKEALEILSRMELKGSPSGKKVMEQVNAVYLGTPHFGFAENVSRRQRTIISPQDPISILPTFGEGARQQWISSVAGGSARDYLSDERVRDAIREAFGYYQGSPEEVRRRIGKRKDSDKTPQCSTDTKNCGEICIPKANTCHINAAITGTTTAAAIGTVGGAGAIAAIYLGTKFDVPLLADNQLQIVNQKYLNKLKPDGTSPKQGAIGKALFVKDASNKRFVFKEVRHNFHLLEAASEATASDIAQKSSININKVSLIPANLKSPLKTRFAGASLHSIVPGKTLAELKTNSNSAFENLNIKQQSGLTPAMLLGLSKHSDLPKIAAFDTFIGNWDRKSENLIYDSRTNSFNGIDNGLAFTRNLSSKTLDNFKNLDVGQISLSERNALSQYLKTLKKLRSEHTVDEIKSRYISYFKHEKGDWNLLKKYSTITNIENNYRNTDKLIQVLEQKLNTSKLDSEAYRLEKELIHLDFIKKCKTGNPCGDICLPVGRKCRIKEFDPRKISAKLGRGAVSQTIGGLGQDLERAYLRTSRLVKQGHRNLTKKQQLTRKEKIKETLAHEAKLLGVFLGQGTVSKTLKTVDEKLIDFSDFVAESPEKISDTVKSIQQNLSNLIKNK
jgi:hypothetical protein